MQRTLFTLAAGVLAAQALYSDPQAPTEQLGEGSVCERASRSEGIYFEAPCPAELGLSCEVDSFDFDDDRRTVSTCQPRAQDGCEINTGEIVPFGSRGYFDGCNRCICFEDNDGFGRLGCTKRACFNFEPLPVDLVLPEAPPEAFGGEGGFRPQPR